MRSMLTALLLAGLISCSDDDQGTMAPQGELSVLLNGEDFLAQFSNQANVYVDEACYADRFALSSSYKNEEGVNRMSFGFSGVPLEVGTHIVERKELGEDRCLQDIIEASFHTVVSDGDVLGDIYLPIETENNHITVSSYNQATKEVEGTFQMILAVELEDHHPYKTVSDAPDTIRLTKGTFRMTLIE